MKMLTVMMKMMMRMTIMCEGEVCRKLSLQRTLVAKKSFSTTMSTIKTAAPATVLDDDDKFPFKIVFFPYDSYLFDPPMTPCPWNHLRLFWHWDGAFK